MPELDVNYIRSQRLHFAGGLPQSFKLTVTSFLTQKLPGEPCGHLEANDFYSLKYRKFGMKSGIKTR